MENTMHHNGIIVPFRVLVFGIDIDVLEVQAAQEKQRQVNGPLAKAESAEKRGAVVLRAGSFECWIQKFL